MISKPWNVSFRSKSLRVRFDFDRIKAPARIFWVRRDFRAAKCFISLEITLNACHAA